MDNFYQSMEAANFFFTEAGKATTKRTSGNNDKNKSNYFTLVYPPLMYCDNIIKALPYIKFYLIKGIDYVVLSLG